MLKSWIRTTFEFWWVYAFTHGEGYIPVWVKKFTSDIQVEKKGFEFWGILLVLFLCLSPPHRSASPVDSLYTVQFTLSGSWRPMSALASNQWCPGTCNLCVSTTDPRSPIIGALAVSQDGQQKMFISTKCGKAINPFCLFYFPGPASLACHTCTAVPGCWHEAWLGSECLARWDALPGTGHADCFGRGSVQKGLEKPAICFNSAIGSKHRQEN